MRQIVIGLLALVLSAYIFVDGTPVLGPGAFELHMEKLSELDWGRVMTPRGLFCAFFVAAGVGLVLRGVQELQRN